ncbi:thioredoxin reductase [Candidatus Nitrotoga sp. AM1P]|nr:thioredoxin reductase [Candidatus Nitrotoga sp. AM1P]
MHFAKSASKVVMLVRAGNFAGTMSKYLSERILSQPNVQVRFNTAVSGLDGDDHLRAITLQNLSTGKEETAAATRLFVCIGGSPNTEWAKDTAIIRNEAGYLITGADLLINGKTPACWPLQRNPMELETSVPGSFAAGDVRMGSTKRAAAAVGEGANCITYVHRYMREPKIAKV